MGNDWIGTDHGGEHLDHMATVSSRAFELRLRRVRGGVSPGECCQYLPLVHMGKVLDEDEARGEHVPVFMRLLR